MKRDKKFYTKKLLLRQQAKPDGVQQLPALALGWCATNPLYTSAGWCDVLVHICHNSPVVFVFIAGRSSS